jgi:hypothetical protein
MIKEREISDIACKKCGGQTRHYHCEEGECEGYLDKGTRCISLHEHDNGRSFTIKNESSACGTFVFDRRTKCMIGINA